MKDLIKATPATVEETKRWRENNPEMPLMTAVHNARASNLMDELNDIRYARVMDVDDVNEKIDKLIEIFIRAIEFKE